jgi:hypothetical protein
MQVTFGVLGTSEKVQVAMRLLTLIQTGMRA